MRYSFTLVNKVQDCSLPNNMKKIQEYCMICSVNQTVHYAISLGRNFCAIPSLMPQKLYITFLTYTYPHTLKHPFKINLFAELMQSKY